MVYFTLLNSPNGYNLYLPVASIGSIFYKWGVSQLSEVAVRVNENVYYCEGGRVVNVRNEA